MATLTPSMLPTEQRGSEGDQCLGREDDVLDKIKNLLSAGSVSPHTKLVLVNAVYFKGDWEDKLSKTIHIQISLLHLMGIW
jgi:hypothetical protein